VALTPNKYQKEAYKTFTTMGIEKFLNAPHDESLDAFDAIEAKDKQKDFTKLMYITGKLNGEAGEFAEEIFKALRTGGDIKERRSAAIDELGDVLWYVAAAATILNVSLEDLMEQNLGKVRAKLKKQRAEEVEARRNVKS